jgi:hypothetical protein
MTRWKCSECGEITESPMIASNPFDPQGANIWGCPKCYAIDHFLQVCGEDDEEGCSSGEAMSDHDIHGRS